VKRESNLSAIHVTLYRLEDKVSSNRLLAVPLTKGWKKKRIYTITSAGMAMLKALKESRIELWKLVPQLKIVGTTETRS